MVLVLDILINIYFSIQSLKENVILWKSHVVSNASLLVRGSLLFFVFVFSRLWRLVKCICDVFIMWCGIIADFKTCNENWVHRHLPVIDCNQTVCYCSSTGIHLTKLWIHFCAVIFENKPGLDVFTEYSFHSEKYICDRQIHLQGFPSIFCYSV